jgi:hypothetical protein
MEREPRKPIGSYWRKPESRPMAIRPRKVIGSSWQNLRRLNRPFHPWEIQAAETWRRQQEREGKPFVIRPRKVIGSYWGEPSRPHPRKVIYSYFRKPQAA